MEPSVNMQSSAANAAGRSKGMEVLFSFVLSLGIALALGWALPGTAAAEPLTLSNSSFRIETGDHGEIASFKLTGDTFPTEYVMNPSNTKKQNTPDHQWLGELMFTYRIDGGAWTKAWSNKSADGRKIAKNGSEITVTYENASDPEGIRNFKVVETYALVDDYVKWSVAVFNTSGKTLEIGDFGLPMPFNEYWTGGDEIYETRVLNHSFVGLNGSYMTIGRASGVGPSLLLVPDASTGAGWEYQDRWKRQEHPGSTWSDDESINGGWPEGLNVYYIHSAVIKSTNKGYLPNTSLVLGPGESKAYAFKFFKVADENENKEKLYEEGLIDVSVVPGMIFATDMKAKFDLHTFKEIRSVTAQYPSDTTITYLGERGEDHHVYELQLRKLGQNDITVEYGNGEKTVLQFYAIEPIADALQRHSTFMVEKTQWDAPGTIRDKAFDDWMMQTKAKRGSFGGYWGWGDDWGLTHGQFLAEKNALSPVASEVEALDAYLDVTVWTNLMAGHHDDYLVRDFLNSEVLYRGYAYPHIYNTYFSMYKIAKLYPDLVDYKESTDTYLLRAYNIFKALYEGPVSYNWETGLMGESTTPELIQALKDEGYAAEANDIVRKMARKYDNFKNTKYPYGSEYSYDNTGEEAVYTLAKMNGNTGMMGKINAKTRAARGHMPVWYYYADPVTITGENWWNFQYTVSLAGYAMDDWVRNHSASPEVEQRMSYAAKIANVGAINSGQIDGDPANIGAASWTYQAEKGNYGALGLDGGPLFNGWRGMTGEADLGLFGAIRILSADVAVDPVFGLTGYGAEVTESGSNYAIVPKDGVFKRLNLITEKLGIRLERDQYERATVAKAKNYVKLDMKSATPGEAHSTRIFFQGLKKATYEVFVNGKSAGKWNAYGNEAALVVAAGTEASYTVELRESTPDPNAAPSVDAGADVSVTLPDAATLEGTAADDGLPAGTLATEWSLVSGPGTAKLEDAGALRTAVELSAAGTYVFKLKATDSELSAEDTVTVVAAPEPPLPEVIARYSFDETGGVKAADSSGNGRDGELKGGTAWTAGKKNGAAALDGKDGYVKLPAGLVSRLGDFTVAAWVKANSLSNYMRVFDFGSGTSTYMFLTPQVGGSMRFVLSTNGNAAGEELQPSSMTVSYWIKRTESMNDRENVLLWFKPEADYANKGLFITYNGDSSIVMVDGTGAFFVKQKPDDFLPEGEWTHVVATFDSATNAAAIYKNGVAQTIDFDGTPDSITATADVKKIGVSGYGDGAQLRASLDDFRIYSGAMTAEQVRALYEETEGKPIVSLKSVSVRTRTGKAPVLPATVEATYSDGTKGQVAVAWELIAKEAYAKAGTFTAKGAVEGTELRAEAVVTVTRPAPSPDAPSAPDAAEKPADPKTLEADSAAWKSGADGSVAIALTGEQTGVSLPVEFASRPDVRSLTVSNGQWTLRMPVSALKAAAGSTSGTQTGSTDGSAAGATAGTTTGTTTGSAASGEARIVVRIEPANGPESSGQEGDASWALAGSAYDWKLALRGADGKETVLSALAEPAELALPYDPARGGDGMTLGVYRWNEGAGKWEYAGGTVDRERHLAKIGLSRTGRYAVLSYEKAFGDVPAGHWAADSIRALVARHVANGTEAGRFDPAGGTTRAEFAALLARALGLTAAEGKPLPFGDVAADAWYAKEVAAACEAGWIQGATAGRFDPSAPVTREQMAVLIVKAYESKQGAAGVGGAPASGEATGSADLASVSPWAKDAVARALALGLMQGKGEGRFDPAAGATRAETAQVVYRLLQLLERPE
ncbi:S-layer homology domain-containing protein [Cohnella xylanilytica]|uniref:S-layer homology domain-containing protein n=3 Tax=Cohnella xylanilytica TaxID=557555 RepID=A0A841TX90_9BACL|nr:S-layer homology domain-containing protein [Cohnella xylanilytica]